MARVRAWYLALTGHETDLTLHLIVNLTRMEITITDEFHAQENLCFPRVENKKKMMDLTREIKIFIATK